MRNYIKWNDYFTKTDKNKKKDGAELKRISQVKKFCRCRECGGQMMHVDSTNLLICHCLVEKEKKDETGKKTFVREECGTVRVIPESYLDYMNYLFN